MKPGELARDERRATNTPRYHGAEWQKAAEEPPRNAEPIAQTTGERPTHRDVRRPRKRRAQRHPVRGR